MEWKGNAPYALCITHDVDRITKQWYHYIFYGCRHPRIQMNSLKRKLYGIEPYWNFGKLIELEKSIGVRSTFFFLNESHREMSPNFWGRYKITEERVAEIIKRLDGDGFEIGLHGSFYSYKDIRLLKKEKDILEKILGHKIVSVRQHHLNYDKEMTGKIHKSLDLKYDSTKGYSDRVEKGQPYRTIEGIIEIPISLMDTVHLTKDTYKQCLEIEEQGGILVLNFHQCHFNETEYQSYVDFYSRILYKAVKDGAWIATMKEVGDWLDGRI